MFHPSLCSLSFWNALRVVVITEAAGVSGRGDNPIENVQITKQDPKLRENQRLGLPTLYIIYINKKIYIYLFIYTFTHVYIFIYVTWESSVDGGRGKIIDFLIIIYTLILAQIKNKILLHKHKTTAMYIEFVWKKVYSKKLLFKLKTEEYTTFT